MSVYLTKILLTGALSAFLLIGCGTNNTESDSAVPEVPGSTEQQEQEQNQQDAADSQIRIATWNILRLGHDEADKDYVGLAAIGNRFDVMALQEVMTEAGLNRFVGQLEKTSGEDWEEIHSDAIGRGSYKEYYAFVYRTSKISYDGAALVYIDSRDVFAREPYSARFKIDASGQTFMMASVHVIYGDSVSQRRTEVTALGEYWDYLVESFPGEALMLVGDFNLTPTDEGFTGLAGRNVSPTLTSGATTLGLGDGSYSNLYDNILVANDGPFSNIRPEIVKFPEILGVSHKVARGTLSDHAPVTFTLSVGK